MAPRIEQVKAALVDVGRSRLDKPFRHHYKPENRCEWGSQTVPSCWEYGLDDSGYDCSGLVIASLWEVLGISGLDRWPENLRHVPQFLSASSPGEPVPGDIVVTVAPQDRLHMGIYTSEGNFIHASGHYEELCVVEGPINPAHEVMILNQTIES